MSSITTCPKKLMNMFIVSAARVESEILEKQLPSLTRKLKSLVIRYASFLIPTFGDFSANDGNVANDLLKILGEAGQEVPEFLSNGGIGSYASGGGGTYGGQDIRKGQEAVTNEDDGW